MSEALKNKDLKRERNMADYFWSYFLYLLLIICFIQTLNSLITKRTQNRVTKTPPGPKPYPIIGNLLELGEKPHKTLAALAQTHGPIMSLRLGQVTTVVVSSSATARQVLQTNDQLLSNRTIPDAVRACDHSELGLAWPPVSAHWRTLRRICNSHLFSNKALDANMSLRHDKVQRELLSEARRFAAAGRAVDIGTAAFRASLSLLSTTFFSEDWSGSGGDTVREIKETVWEIMEVVGAPNAADFFPLLRWLDPQGIRRRCAVRFRKLLGLFGRIIKQRLRARAESEGRRRESVDVLDCLLDMIGDDHGREDRLDERKIEHLLLDLFAAGTETTSSTLEWSMAELLKSPETMSKAREELNRVIGNGNQVKESDISHLPYLQAIVKETLRLHPAVPLLLPRKAGDDVEISGYTVPKGSQVLVNAWAVGRDPAVWENPNEFVPERFLGSSVGRDFEAVPFGGGRRICPGWPLAMRMLHLMLSSLVHGFDWKLESGESLDMEDKFGITLRMAKPLRAVPS